MTIFFWQEVAEKYQEVSEEFDELGFQYDTFLGVDPAVKLEHSWKKLHETYKGLMKSYTEADENHKKVVAMMTLKTLLGTAVSFFTFTCG
jgi:hypothetical protein